MVSKKSFFYFFILSFLATCSLFGKTTISKKQINDFEQIFNITLSFGKKDFVLQESVDFSVDHPALTISQWSADQTPTEKYLPSFKDTKKIFTKNVTFTVKTTSSKPFLELQDAHLYLSYYQGSKKKTVQDILLISGNFKKQETIIARPSDPVEKEISRLETPVKDEDISWSEKVSGLVAKTETLWIRVLLVLLLGLLMSLTPCIYPMIPITLGILQSSSSKSVAYNFLQALFYTLGIATTFAIIGLIAAFTGQMFGSIMSSPVFIVLLAALLVYLAGSMFGLYNMYTPKFMLGGSSSNPKKHSLISIFIFGAISGTVASPCLSPGLILLLSIVTALGSKILGFVLLFAFGFGLGIPLLIIGTFSSSLNALPKAGMWMIEVKKIFGFMLIGMALYFLSGVLPMSVIYFITTLFLLASSLFYFYSIKKSDSKGTKAIKNMIGVIAAVFAVLYAAQTYKAIVYKDLQPVDRFWYCDPEAAFNVAKKEQKKLFMDISGQFCSICKAIDKGLLSDKKVRSALSKFINLKIDDSDSQQDIFESICSKYSVIGFPTFLLIDAQTGDLIARWGSELYDVTAEEFVDVLKKY